MKDFQTQREKMIKKHLKNRDITDSKVISAIEKVSRENFVPAQYQDIAYKDTPLPIGQGQTISQPYIVAKMCQILNLSQDECVMDIGTGLGYQAAVLSHLASEVITIEIKKGLGEKAKKNLASYDNVKVVIKDGRAGYPKKAPYDAIISAAAAKNAPNAWKEQLKTGGRIVYPKKQTLGQQLVKLSKTEQGFEEKSYSRVRFVDLVS